MKFLLHKRKNFRLTGVLFVLMLGVKLCAQPVPRGQLVGKWDVCWDTHLDSGFVCKTGVTHLELSNDSTFVQLLSDSAGSRADTGRWEINGKWLTFYTYFPNSEQAATMSRYLLSPLGEKDFYAPYNFSYGRYAVYCYFRRQEE